MWPHEPFWLDGKSRHGGCHHQGHFVASIQEHQGRAGRDVPASGHCTLLTSTRCAHGWTAKMTALWQKGVRPVWLGRRGQVSLLLSYRKSVWTTLHTPHPPRKILLQYAGNYENWTEFFTRRLVHDLEWIQLLCTKSSPLEVATTYLKNFLEDYTDRGYNAVSHHWYTNFLGTSVLGPLTWRIIPLTSICFGWWFLFYWFYPWDSSPSNHRLDPFGRIFVELFPRIEEAQPS